jgi:hypothetical protein
MKYMGYYLGSANHINGANLHEQTKTKYQNKMK